MDSQGVSYNLKFQFPALSLILHEIENWNIKSSYCSKSVHIALKVLEIEVYKISDRFGGVSGAISALFRGDFITFWWNNKKISLFFGPKPYF